MFRILIIGVAVLAVVGFVVLLNSGGQPAPQVAVAAPQTVSIIVTARAVRAGSLLQPGDLAAKTVPVNAVPAGAQQDNQEARTTLIGAMVRRMLDQQEPIISDDVLRPGDRGFLAAVLKPGMRAVSVAVDAVTGAAGLIWPGDRVDLILTQTLENADQALARRVAGEIVLGDVQVIAVDQQLVQGGQASGVLDTHTQASRTITLEVTPDDASRVAVASRLGRLQVALRAAQSEPRVAAQASRPDVVASPVPAAAPGPVQTPPNPPSLSTMWAGDVSHALAPSPGERARDVHVFQGGKPAEIYKF